MAFQQGLSGLTSNARALDVVSHNISNSNTSGYKSSQTVFSDIYSQTLGANPYNQVGSGGSVPAVRQNFSQGAIVNTGNALDMAINGEGFFMVKRAVQGDIQRFYTRAGEFQLDKDGYIVSSTGYQLLGFPGGAGSGDPVPLKVPFDAGQPVQTTSVQTGFNLDANAPVISAPFNASDPNTYNFSTSVQVYDSLGISHAMTFYFRKQTPAPPNYNWDVYVTVDGSNYTPSAPFGPQTLTFNASGQLTAPNPATINVTGITLTNGANIGTGGTIAWDFNATQYAIASSVNTLQQNGKPPGNLTSVSVSREGRVQARYTNGDVQDIGTVALADFRDPNALISMGDNLWTNTLESGDPLVGSPGSGRLGYVTGGAVESSNVDLTQELVNMIIYQRAYQANAQSIRTQDQILQTVINLR
ncbi:MAG: flagellar hook protein FlgE [Hydrogenophilus sp.]|nr:flagellar hook protein FlgE [Hydrogenophilus sp.]